MDIKSKTLTFHEARRPWDEWGIRKIFGSINPKWGNCTPSDIDSVIELNGYFLFIEDKPWDERYSINIYDGQMRMYQNLVALSDKVSVWILLGERDNPQAVYSIRRDEINYITDKSQLMEMISNWAKYVDKKSKGF